MKKPYISPELVFLNLSTADIINTSGPVPGEGGGAGGDPLTPEDPFDPDKFKGTWGSGNF